MPVQKIEGVRVDMSPHKKLDFDYDPSDMKTLYRRGEWKNWQQGIKWLEQSGERDNRLTPGETIAMVEDLRSLQSSKAPFTEDPEQAYKLAHKFRKENNRKYSDEHAQAVEMARKMR